MVSARLLKNDPRFGIDSWWSWITAFFCAWVLFLAMATPRMAGIFFYGIVETFGATRNEASWPVSLAGTFTVLGGPIAGYLCQRFSCRAVLLVCSPLAGVGVCLCYLARDLLFITIFLGIIHGTALCGLYVASNILLAQHFEKRRATAISLVFTAFGFSSVVLTPLIEFLRKTYGIRGAFLIYGAILLNTIPAVIVLRSPPWLTKSEIAKKVMPNEEDQKKATCLLIQPANEDVSIPKAIENHDAYSSKRLNFQQEQENMSHTGLFTRKSSLKLMEAKEALLNFSLPAATRQIFTLSFLVHALSFAAVIIPASVFLIIMGDITDDHGLNPSNAVYFLQALSAADIALRSVVGITVDSQTLSHESVMVIGYLVQGLTYEWLIWANTVPQMIAVSVLMGATYGSRTCLQAPVLVKDFGIGNLPVIMGGVFFCIGVSLLLRPSLIGYFRDTYGDYNGLLHLMAALNALFMCIWVVKLVTQRKTGRL
ncbi:monocarboxylate transporter 3-like [Dermacentor andersoni]|uniref:monocarboxylate transporter 3-like n=1 Tax=Dermacentor andersoni TaxID=34620 RepID=UPI003B3A5B93